VLARSTLTISPGSSAAVSIKLRNTGAALLRTNKHLTATLKMTLARVTSHQLVRTRTISLSVPAKPRH